MAFGGGGGPPRPQHALPAVALHLQVSPCLLIVSIIKMDHLLKEYCEGCAFVRMMRLGCEACWYTTQSVALSSKSLRAGCSAFHEAHETGAPVARPVFWADPRDGTARDADGQFLLGDSVLVSPVLTEGADSVSSLHQTHFDQGLTLRICTSLTVRYNTSARYGLPDMRRDVCVGLVTAEACMVRSVTRVVMAHTCMTACCERAYGGGALLGMWAEVLWHCTLGCRKETTSCESSEGSHTEYINRSSIILQVRAYFPRGIWYSMWNPSHVDALAYGVHETLAAPLGHVPLHVRGGTVVAMQQAALTTTEVRSSPLTLVVALAPEVTPHRRHPAHPPSPSPTARRVFLSSACAQMGVFQRLCQTLPRNLRSMWYVFGVAVSHCKASGNAIVLSNASCWRTIQKMSFSQ